MSPSLFNSYINDLVRYLKSLNIGDSFSNEKICMLLFDIVLLAENADDLQILLDALCCTNDTNIKVILYSYLILKKMNERITDS